MSTTPRPLAVVLDGAPTPAWQARALAGLRCSPSLEVVQVRLMGPAHRGLARRLHAAVERRLLRLGADPLAPASAEATASFEASASTGVPASVGASASAEASAVEASASVAMSPASQARMLVVWLSERHPPEGDGPEILFLRHGLRVEPAEDALRRAMLTGASSLETEVLLRRGRETELLERTVSEVRPFSITLALGLMLWKLAAVVPRVGERLAGLDRPAPSVSAVTAAALASAPAPVPAPAPAPAKRAPPFAALIARSAVAWPRIVATRLLFRRPWAVRVRERGAEPTAGWSQAQDAERELVRWTPGSMYADPFLFEHEGRHHLFCEEVPIGAARAVISHTELALDGSAAAAPTPILCEPHHLSYPFVFAHEGELFMIPESSAVRRVELYRAVAFPKQWRREAVLIDDLDVADATLLVHGDRLWLFAGVAAPDASSLDELYLFWAHELRGPWHAHARNPVVSDARCARPGGAIQRWGSRLVRPGQDGSRRYGGSISFREIDLLSPDEYAEHEIARLDPVDVRGARATHTYSADGRFEAIDVRRRELRVDFRLTALRGDFGRRGGRLGGR